MKNALRTTPVKLAALILVSIFLSSCNDEYTTQQPHDEDILGVWQLNEKSKANLKGYKIYPNGRSSLTLKSNNEFVTTEFPVISGGVTKDTEIIKLVRVAGKWTLISKRGFWMLHLRFLDGEVFDLNVRHLRPPYELTADLSDPDSLDRLTFVRAYR